MRGKQNALIRKSEPFIVAAQSAIHANNFHRIFGRCDDAKSVGLNLRCNDSALVWLGGGGKSTRIYVRVYLFCGC